MIRSVAVKKYQTGIEKIGNKQTPEQLNAAPVFLFGVLSEKSFLRGRTFFVFAVYNK